MDGNTLVVIADLEVRSDDIPCSGSGLTKGKKSAINNPKSEIM